MNPTSLLTGLGAAIGAEPALGGASSASRTATPGTGDLFLSLVAGLLGNDAAVTGPGSATPETPGGTPAEAEAAPGAAQPATDDDATEQPAGETDAADGTAVPMVPTLAAIIAQAATVVSTPAIAPVATEAEAATTGSPEAPEGVVGGVDPADAAAPGPAAAVPSARAGLPADTAATAAQTDASTGAPADALVGSGPDSATESASSPAAHQAARPEARADVPPAPVVPTSLTPVAASTAPAAAVTALTPSAETQRVTGQIFPEVVRVAATATPGGTQRLTVRLNPESLGEVRVVLTHHKGELAVSLAGGEAARHALAEGAPELRRLLESVGRADSRIVIRDLPGTAPTPTPAVQDGSALRTDVSTDLGGNAWSGAGRPGGESAADRETARYRTPGSTNATDGTRDSTIPSRHSTTDASGRSGGLDVSI